MRVHLGPYCSWFGPYQCAGLLRYLGFSEDFCEWLGEKLPEKPFQWFDDTFKHRKIKIKIHDYDTWSMDYTLSLIILPMLRQLRETKHGAPDVEDEDVPDYLKRSAAPPVENEWDTDDNWFRRWDWVLDQMIWSMQEIALERPLEGSFHDLEKKTFDKDGISLYYKKIDLGCRLFGKYFQNLWD